MVQQTVELTKNFTLQELTKSATATRLGIDNSPSQRIINNLTDLSTKVLQPIRNKYGKPIIVTSGYRCVTLNKAVGGAPFSQHCQGQAADIKSVSDSITDNKALFDLIVKMIQSGEIVVGQLIDEHNFDWIHVSTPSNNKTNQIKHIK